MPSSLSRRAVLLAGLAAGGGLQVASVTRAMTLAGEATAPTSLNAFVRIGADGGIHLTLARAEMGQGVSTSLVMLLAEELDAPLDKVSIDLAPSDIVRYGLQVTGGSKSIVSNFQALRVVGAAAREMLVAEAAERWGAPTSACATRDAQVIHKPSGRVLAYDVLAVGAARRTPPQDPTLKTPDQFRLIGKATTRLDAKARVDGSVRYGMDASPPGVQIAVAAYPPQLGGAIASVDDLDALAVAGVTKVLRAGDSVVVLARNTFAALKGREALKIQWTPPAQPVSNAAVFAALEAAVAAPGAVAASTPGVDAALAGEGLVEATYHQPYLAHAAMEPMNCVARVSAEGCEIWTGTQVIGPAQMVVASVLGLKPDKVVIHNQPIGGAFGRRLELDGILAAVAVARQVDFPIKLIWTREDDLLRDLYRPAYVDHLAARLDADGYPVAWRHRIAGSSIMARLYPKDFKGVDHDAVECAAKPIYRLKERQVEFSRVETPGVTTSWWRGVGALRSTFALESFIDELAVRAGADPAAYRRALIDDPRLLAVLDRVLTLMNWPAPKRPERGMGLAIQHAFNSYGAMIVEAHVQGGVIKVERIGCAIDCGIAINPRGIEAQVQGGALFGLSAALTGQVTFSNGAVDQTNFDTYTVLRMDAAPPIDLALIESAEAPGGLGELPTILVAPALANAVAAATGQRRRRLPLNPQATA